MSENKPFTKDVFKEFIYNRSGWSVTITQQYLNKIEIKKILKDKLNVTKETNE